MTNDRKITDGPWIAPSDVDTGHVVGDGVVFPAWRGEADKPSSPPPAPWPHERRVGFAVVGLGRLTLEEILPAFRACLHARVVALVSGTPHKLETVAHQYGVPPSACYDYASFDRVIDDPAIEAVYIVLPNAMHHEFVLRAARAGKHVLCEKPMANTVEEAQDMVAACERAAVKLMIAYRCQYEAHHLEARRFVREGTFGKLKGLTAVNTQTVAKDGQRQWRHKLAMAGGGVLPDIGLYCLNAARFLAGEEPCEVFAQSVTPAGDPRFAEVEETVSFMLRFPSGFIANAFSSYGAREDKAQRLSFERATVDMPNAYAYTGQQLVIGERCGDDSQQRAVQRALKSQFAAEIDHMALCVREDRTPHTPGEEGVRDQKIMAAIYASAQSHRPIKLD